MPAAAPVHDAAPMDAYMHQHLAVERREHWIRAAAASRDASVSQASDRPTEPSARRAPVRRLARRPHLRIAR